MTDGEFLKEGWHCIDAGDLPSPDEVVEFGRDDRVYRQAHWIGRWSELDPAFNVAGLWWARCLAHNI